MLVGGSAGQGVRVARTNVKRATSFFVWGGSKWGFLPLVFDWFFLVAQANLTHGLVGPVLFVFSAMACAFLKLNVDGGAVISALMGSVALFLGILSAPLMLQAAKTGDPGTTDYAFGGCFVLMFVMIGPAFAWNGSSAIFLGATLDQKYGEPDQELDAPRKFIKN